MTATELRVEGHPSADELAAALVVLSSRRDAPASASDGRTGFAAGWRAGRRAVLQAAEPTHPAPASPRRSRLDPRAVTPTAI